MDLFSLLFTLIILGFVAFLVLKYIPMAEPIRTIVIVIAVIILIGVVMNAFGVGPHLNLGHVSR